ncbi:MAG TPA: Gfo/Idh/MocA family oxidoreductase [Terrimicrobiaceae bacterium]|nr:Gfo/Idh/MocA family oxidoreductase [Terrimicrobiaceae bacterium]
MATSSAAAAFPSLVRAETLGGNGGVAASNRITMGIIGLGSQGILHLRNNLSNPALQIVALCDVDRERLAAARGVMKSGYADRTASGEFSGAQETQDFREVLARADVDTVLCALPDHWHALPVILAVQAGKDVFTEKPFSLTIAEGRAMVDAVRRAGAVCQVGSQQRSGRSFRRAVELARSGALGRITRVEVGLPGRYNLPQLTAPLAPQQVPEGFDYEFWLGPAPWAPYYKERCRTFFRFNYDYSGGQLTDWIGHHFDIANWALGMNFTGPVAIREAQAEFWDSPLYDTPMKFSFEAHYAGGAAIRVTSQDEAGRYEIGEIFNDSDGGIFLEGSEGWVRVGRARMAFSSPRLQALVLPSDGFRLDDPEQTSRPSHMENFLHCVRTRETPVASAEEGHRTATVAHLANIAFRTGRRELHWDPDREVILDAPEASRLLARAYRAPWQLPT